MFEANAVEGGLAVRNIAIKELLEDVSELFLVVAGEVAHLDASDGDNTGVVLTVANAGRLNAVEWEGHDEKSFRNARPDDRLAVGRSDQKRGGA